MKEYERLAAGLRAPLPDDPTVRELIRYATLAPNAHNTQPWCFRPGGHGVSILPDRSRRTPVVDPDDHHLFMSLGCAAEHLMLAAAARGYAPGCSFDPAEGGRIDIELPRKRATVAAGPGPATDDAGASPGDPGEAGAAVPPGAAAAVAADGTVAAGVLDERRRSGAAAAHTRDELAAAQMYAAIPERQSTRCTYDGSEVTSAVLHSLEAGASLHGVHVTLITERNRLEQLLEFVVAANSLQMQDDAFMNELRRWIRFDARHALETRDGLFGGCSGSPQIPAWLGRPLFRQLIRKGPQNDRYARQIRSSAGVAVFTCERPGPAGWVDAGRSFDRFALQSTALGLRHAHLNQPVECEAVRHDFAAWLGAPEARPDLVIRFGRAAAMPMSLRRPVEAVVV